MSNPDHNLDGVSIGQEARIARERNRAERRRAQKFRREKAIDPLGLAQYPFLLPYTPPEHYHVVYQHEDRAVVHWARKFLRQRDAYLEVERLGKEAEPNTEWYDDGRVMIETTLHGRTGLYRVYLRVTACINAGCGAGPSPIILPTGGLHVVQ